MSGKKECWLCKSGTPKNRGGHGYARAGIGMIDTTCPISEAQVEQLESELREAVKDMFGRPDGSASSGRVPTANEAWLWKSTLQAREREVADLRHALSVALRGTVTWSTECRDAKADVVIARCLVCTAVNSAPGPQQAKEALTHYSGCPWLVLNKVAG